MSGSNNWEIRPARGTDLGGILALERATGLAPHWPDAAYQDILESGRQRRCLIVAELDQALVGFAAGMVEPEDSVGSSGRTGELESVAVAAASRRAGIGRALCEGVIQWCHSKGVRTMLLEVRSSSAGAISLYRKLGFVRQGVRPHYYRDPVDDAIVMRLALGD